MPKTVNHIHQFRKKVYKSTGNAIFFCTLENCYFKMETQLTLGKLNLCNRCGKPFKMNAYNLRRVLPHCEDCHKIRAGVKVNTNAYTVDEQRTLPEQRVKPDGESLDITEKMARLTNLPQPDEEIDEEILL